MLTTCPPPPPADPPAPTARRPTRPHHPPTHFPAGWNSCSSCHADPSAPARKLLVLPTLGSGRVYGEHLCHPRGSDSVLVHERLPLLPPVAKQRPCVTSSMSIARCRWFWATAIHSDCCDALKLLASRRRSDPDVMLPHSTYALAVICVPMNSPARCHLSHLTPCHHSPTRAHPPLGVDVATDPRAPRLAAVAESEDIIAKTGLSALHSSHCESQLWLP